MSNFRRILLAVIILGLAAVSIRLGVWQLDRRAERRATNAVLRAGLAAPSLDLSGPPDSIQQGRILTATGHFDPAGQLLLRGRVNNKAPGLEVMTPFRSAGNRGATVWVLRGSVASPDATTPPDEIPSGAEGEVTVRGTLLPLPTTADAGQPLTRDGITTYRRLDRDVAHRLLPEAPPLYLLLEGGVEGPGGLPSIPAPTLDDGPHFSYAIQWFGIALAILAFGFIALRRGDPARARHRAAP